MLTFTCALAFAAEPALPPEGAPAPKPVAAAKPSAGNDLKFQLVAGGLSAGLLGGLAVGGTWGYYTSDPEVQPGGWQALKVANAAGWAGIGVGLGLIGVGLALPSDGDAEVRLWVRPRGAGVVARF